jgi:hypothetical protein
MNEPHDDLGELLAPKPDDIPIVYRDALFAQTNRRVSWNRRVRLIPKAVAVLTIFVLGVWAGTGRTPTHPPVDLLARTMVIHEVVPVVIVVPVPQPSDPSGPIAKTPEPMTASDAELRAELADEPQEAARFYRTAGDKYLNDASDYPNAARCYRLFLARAGSVGLNPEPGDTWLLTSLKNAAFKEMSHAAKNGG